MLGISGPPVWSFRWHQWKGLGERKGTWSGTRFGLVYNHIGRRSLMVMDEPPGSACGGQCDKQNIRHSSYKDYRMVADVPSIFTANIGWGKGRLIVVSM